MGVSVERKVITAGNIGTEVKTPAQSVLGDRLKNYCRIIGIQKEAIIEEITHDSMTAASRGSDTDDPDLIFYRAVEYINRRFDIALSGSIESSNSKDRKELALLKAAILLSEKKFQSDQFFEQGGSANLELSELQKLKPQNTPPESNLPMPETKLQFWLFKSIN